MLTTTDTRKLVHKLRTIKNLWTDANNYLHLTNDSYMTSLKTDIPQLTIVINIEFHENAEYKEIEPVIYA